MHAGTTHTGTTKTGTKLKGTMRTGFKCSQAPHRQTLWQSGAVAQAMLKAQLSCTDADKPVCPLLKGGRGGGGGGGSFNLSSHLRKLQTVAETSACIAEHAAMAMHAVCCGLSKAQVGLPRLPVQLETRDHLWHHVAGLPSCLCNPAHNGNAVSLFPFPPGLKVSSTSAGILRACQALC